MPWMNGPEFYRKVQEIAPSITEHMVFITRDVMGDETHDFLLKTGALHITKPIDVNQLRQMVNVALSGARHGK